MRIGLDLGGTKIECAVFDASDKLLWRQRVATPTGDYRATLEAMVGLVLRAERELQCSATIGVGTPGSPCPTTGLMRNCNSTCLNGQDLQSDLNDALQRDVRMANDADCFALSEALAGAARGLRSVFGVILGTGVGGGLVYGGELLQGANAIAGEWGHNRLSAAGRRPARDCYCGRSNCIETWLSGPGLSLSYKQRYGEERNAREIAASLRVGDARAEAIFNDYCVDLAHELAQIVNIYDPHAIILGGGLGQLPGLVPALQSRIRPLVFSDSFNTRIALPEFGDSSGVRGAAWLWPIEV